MVTTVLVLRLSVHVVLSDTEVELTDSGGGTTVVALWVYVMLPELTDCGGGTTVEVLCGAGVELAV